MTTQTGDKPMVTHPIDVLRQTVADDIDRNGSWSSFMIRNGKLADLLDELARHREQETLSRESRVQKYLGDEAAARERLATFPDAVRQRLTDWQTGQSEWFSNTVLEIVAEFIAFDDSRGVAQNKAGGLWYRRWLAAQTRLNELEETLSREQSRNVGRETLLGLEWTEDGYSLRTPYDGDADGDGRPIVVGGDIVVTFADSDEGEEAREAFIATLTTDQSQTDRLREALEPFAAMGRVMEIRARVTFGKVPKDSDIVCESSGEAGLGILTMGHFRDAAALLPDAPGWGGIYKPLNRAALSETRP